MLNYGERLRRFAYRPIELDARINLLDGAVRSGKTWALHPKTLYACRYPVNGWRVITGVSKQTIFNNVLNDLFNLVGPSNYTYNHQSGLLRLCESSWLVMGAKDEGSEKYIRGLTVGVVIGDQIELMPQEFFQMLLTRMSPEGSRFYGTLNPANPLHWLKTEFIDNEKLRNLGMLSYGHYTMDDNPNLSTEYIESQKQLYTGVFYERYILGKWVVAEAAIYRDVLGNACYYTDADRPQALLTSFAARYIGVDYGTINPCVFLEIFDDGKTLWQEREYYWDSQEKRRQKTDSEYADDFDAFVGRERRGLVVIADPSAASFKLELVKRGYQVMNGENEVLEGIRRVSVALKAGMYRIHARNNPKTLKELEVYSWSEKAAKRGEEEPIKENDHTCFVAGTLISTPAGVVPIESISPGDLVLSPLGRARILEIGVREAECIDTGVLIGTPEHPIFSQGKWVRLDAVEYNELCELNQSYSMESSSGVTRTPSAPQTAITFVRMLDISAPALRRCTSRFGRASTGQFLPVIMCTTSTRIQETTILPISNVFPVMTTYLSIPKENTEIPRTWLESSKWPRRGIDQKRAVHGTASKREKQSLVSWKLAPHTFAAGAGRNFRAVFSGVISTAMSIANSAPAIRRIWARNPAFARSVASLLWRISTASQKPVAAHAVHACGGQKVYTIKTEHGCYIANGILVSNCDVIRMCVSKMIPKWRVG